jgi:hypothetical protein
MMLVNFAVGLPMMILCLVVEVAVAYWCVQHYVRHLLEAPPAARLGFVAGVRPLVVAMLAMLAGTFVEIGLWAGLFVLLGEFADAYDAVYHSTVNFTSLGYGDIVMSKRWRLLGPLEALNGVLMLGMTAAALMVILQHMVRSQRDALLAGRKD